MNKTPLKKKHSSGQNQQKTSSHSTVVLNLNSMIISRMKMITHNSEYYK